MQLVLRVPRYKTTRALLPAASSKAETGEPPETALGVDGIELREQTHEEALLSTIGELCSFQEANVVMLELRNVLAESFNAGRKRCEKG